MKEIYLDIMEKALSAYTREGIRAYIDEVKRDGLKEHGFPRLGVNIGLLIAHGRRTELLDTFLEIMDICCEEMPRKKAANDFSVREVCCCLMALDGKGVVSPAQLADWKRKLAAFDPWKYYTIIDRGDGRFLANWALFSAVSEFMRGIYCGMDTTEFVDKQLPAQLAYLDENDMYQDDPPYANHTVYDLVPRYLIAFLLRVGYKGKYAARLEQVLDNTAELTLKMQSVTGELAFGGRSNQFLNNEPMICSYCEMEAARFAQRGDLQRAGQFKAAAGLAAEATLGYLSLEPISHIKNRYDVATKYGCEEYGYFNKYMITVASNVYMAYMFADDSIAPTVAPAREGGYVIRTGEHFHKTFLAAGGYHIEIETNADIHYDANGLGRVHKLGCPSALCLSVPFARKPAYKIEGKNRSAMSLCAYGLLDGSLLLAAEQYATYRFLDSKSSPHWAEATFAVQLGQAVCVKEHYRVSEKGVEITLSDWDAAGFMVPVFDFDGAEHTQISLGENAIAVSYQGHTCTYRFDGEILGEPAVFYNRNGRYKVYQVASKKMQIELQ